MRSFDIKSLAFLASSLLVKESFAAPIFETEVRVVTEEITVTKEADGTYETGVPYAIGTFTHQASTSLRPLIQHKAAKISSEAAAAFVQTSSSTTPTTLATYTSAKSALASSSSSSSGKRGIAYNTADYVKSFTGSSKVSWAYNWGSSSDGLSASGIEYVPLLWGLKSTFTGAWNAAASSAISSGTKHLMSFNEPDLSSQANLGYADAAAGYKQYMEPFAGKAKLGAPAVTNGAAPMGLTWLKSFLSECSDCTIDFVCIHWYDSASNVDYFKSYVQDAYTAGGNRPLWITEFQASGSTDEQNAFLDEVLPWLDASDRWIDMHGSWPTQMPVV
ncbi:hypothetical protein DID88_009594 [Monilinia fructigena]|uniref:Asl1-like glycosyl hydrolase catalytic domain-containing protein n=1 Tax=Monilinia fructigena TaxID=38457 RepID=A0A395IMN4_9HELO|nr:hypothetical protein DID88_009594 [Monilinia fructigena]